MKLKDFYESNVWLDLENKPVKTKIKSGLDHYLKKFNNKPDVIFISEKEMGEIGKGTKISGIPIMSDKIVMPKNYWYAIKEKRKK